MPAPPKPRMKPSHRFSELERKVQLLTDALASKDAHSRDEGHKNMSSDGTSTTPKTHGRDHGHENPRLRQLHDAPRIVLSQSTEATSWWNIETPTAIMIVKHWHLEIRPFLPIISSTSDEILTEVRISKPTLFLAILAVSSPSLLPTTSPQLRKQLSAELARHIHVDGKRSIELVQALLLQSHYFVPPENSTNFAFTQHAYTASAMAFDLGLDKQARSSSSVTDAKKAEATRAWLAVYYTMSISTTLLRRQRVTFDSVETKSIMADLINSACVITSDRALCSLVRLQSIVEECSMTIGKVSYDATEFDKPSTQYQLRALHQRLNQWKESVSEESDATFLNHKYHSAKLYIYQIAIRAYIGDIFTSNKGSDHRPILSLSVIHIEALAICLECSQKVINALTSLNLAVLRCLPTVYLIWNLFAAVCLIKMAPYVELQEGLRLFDSYSQPGIYVLDDITQLLDGLITKLDIACQDGYMVHGKPFVTALKKLRVWYLQKAIVCINSRQEGDHDDVKHVRNLLARQLHSPPASHASEYTQDSLNAVPSPINNVTQQYPTVFADLQQVQSLSFTNSTQQSDQLDMTPPFEFSIESNEFDTTSNPKPSSDTDQNLINMDYNLNQFDESLLSYNEQWLTGLLGLDLAV